MAKVADDEFCEAMENLDMHEMQSKDPEPDSHGQGGYRFDTPEHQQQLKDQRAQLWSWLKRVGSHMFKEGINLTKISLPVCLFEPRSFLERLTTNWEYNSLLVAAAGCADPADRLRFIVAFAVSGLCRQVSFHKPFNPILGETYQAVYPNGVEVYCEQISHHPPISSWEVYEPSGKFVFYGNGNWVAGIKGNSVKGRQTGSNCVRFDSDGATIEYELPGLQVKGVLWGVRVLKYSGQMVFKDNKNGLQAIIDVDPPAPNTWGSWFRAKKGPAHKPDQVVGRLMRGDQLIDTCHGSWLHYLEWDKGVAPEAAAAAIAAGAGTAGPGPSSQRRLWDMRTSRLSPAVPLEAPLPSDCRAREDVVFLKAGDQEKAQEWKQTLEERQRRDRKLRKDGGCTFDH
ncbi:Oxysterol-binding protein 4 [Pleodorina starrii]|uniref:Oxysterol-binding protein 4 n=1 Tax=Pleodorina starrii TaxID=330485 RepID=A0A9W6BVP7_9CHLO|nr:Oxysterol-binding protein 4 [Pleodorina starrii]